MERLGVGEGSLAAHTTKNPLQLRRGFANEQIYLLLSFKQQMRLVGISTIVRKLTHWLPGITGPIPSASLDKRYK